MLNIWLSVVELWCEIKLLCLETAKVYKYDIIIMSSAAMNI